MMKIPRRTKIVLGGPLGGDEVVGLTNGILQRPPMTEMKASGRSRQRFFFAQRIRNSPKRMKR